jgi:hypothetical protein
VGNENSSVTRVWPVLSELMCSGRRSEESLRIVFDLAFKKGNRKLAKILSDSVDRLFRNCSTSPLYLAKSTR